MRTHKAICLEQVHFGYPLRDARLKAGRSLDDISRRTKIPTVTLERLEEGNRDALPADVFVCGFLRAYARELGVDAEEAVMRYRVVAPVAHPCDREPQVDLHDHEVVEIELRAPVSQPSPKPESTSPVNSLVAGWSARLQTLLDGNGAPGQSRGPTFALVVLLVVLVATITLSLLLGGDPRPGRGLS